MADIFISYSRRDLEFVERLRKSLAERDKDVWFDREDIGPAVVWRRELWRVWYEHVHVRPGLGEGT